MNQDFLFLYFMRYRHKITVMMITIAAPEMKNQRSTPAFSAIGLLNNSPTGMVTDEISVRTENARPIFSGAAVS